MHALNVDFRAAGNVLSVLPEKEKTVGDFAALLKQSQANSAERAMADKWTVAEWVSDRAADRAAELAAERAADKQDQVRDNTSATDPATDPGDATGAPGREYGLSHHPLLAQLDLTPEDVQGGGLHLGDWRGPSADPINGEQSPSELLAALNELRNQLAASPLAHSLTGSGGHSELPPGAQGPDALAQILTGLLQSENGASLAALSLAELPKDILAKLQSLLAINSTPGATTDTIPAGAPDSAPAQTAALCASNTMSTQLMQFLRDHGVRLVVAQNNNWTSQPSFGGTLFTASQIASAGFGSANGGTDSNFFGQGFFGEGSANSAFSGASLPDVASGATAAASSGQVSVNDFHGNLLALMGTEPGAAIALRSAAQLQASGAFDGRRIPGTTPEAVTSQISVHIQRAIQDGQDRVRIRLDPAELGRIDVKLELGHDGRLQAAIGAERHETLELLQRDARQLERALQEAGFKTDQQNFSFDLGFAKHEQTAGSAGNSPNTGDQLSAGLDALSELTTPATARPHHDGAIDIQA